MKRFVVGSLTGLAVGLAVANQGAVTQWVQHVAVSPPAQAEPAQPAARHGDEPIADLVERVGPSVVNIDTLSRRPNPMRQLPFFMMEGNDPQAMSPYVEQKGVGSGFIVSSDGKVLTNNHVVQGATSLTVTLPDGRKFPGKVVGRDSSRDIALVKIEAKNLPALSLADAGKVRVGQRVVAIGSPLGLSHTVTSGIVSALHRGLDDLNARVDFIQTDTAINPGNSGGPLLNMDGQVIGMNTAIANRAQGIGFAIPSDTLQTASQELETKGTVTRAWLGIQVGDGVPGRGPAIVAGIVAGSPAEKADFQPGDVVEQIDGKAIADARSVIRTIGRHGSRDQVKVLVRRNGEAITKSVQLAEMPEQQARDE